MPEDAMTEVEKKAFKNLVDTAFLTMDELRAVLMKARDAENPLQHDDEVMEKHDNLGEALRSVMLALGFDDDDDDDEGGGEEALLEGLFDDEEDE